MCCAVSMFALHLEAGAEFVRNFQVLNSYSRSLRTKAATAVT